MTDSLTTYKLTVLYMLGKVDFPLTNSQISEFILDKGYTNYFTLQQVFNELADAQLLRVKQIRNSTHYSITKAGQETLQYFGENIPKAIRDDVDTFLSEHHYQLRSESETIADYYQEKPHLFLVKCEVREGGQPLISLTLSVTTEEQAIAICDNWQKHNSDIYSYLIGSLLK